IMFQREQFVACRGIPYASEIVIACCQNPFSICTPLCVYKTWMLKLRQLLSGLFVPNRHRTRNRSAEKACIILIPVCKSRLILIECEYLSPTSSIVDIGSPASSAEKLGLIFVS